MFTCYVLIAPACILARVYIDLRQALLCRPNFDICKKFVFQYSQTLSDSFLAQPNLAMQGAWCSAVEAYIQADTICQE